MDLMWIAILLAFALLALLSLGVWVSFTLITIGGLGLILSENYQVNLLFATSSWGASTAWSLTALPLFIWMGEVLFRTRLSEDLFKGLSPWLNGVPGKLLHVNILSCGIFAAVSGSSAATAATIGRMTLPELRKQGYSERHGNRYFGRFRHIRPVDSTLHHFDCLWRGCRSLDCTLVHRGSPARTITGQFVHGLYYDLGLSAQR